MSRLVVVGFFTNFCVETTVRMAGNSGFDCYLAISTGDALSLCAGDVEHLSRNQGNE